VKVEVGKVNRNGEEEAERVCIKIGELEQTTGTLSKKNRRLGSEQCGINGKSYILHYGKIWRRERRQDG